MQNCNGSPYVFDNLDCNVVKPQTQPANGNVQQPPIVNNVPPIGNPQPVNNNNNGYNDIDDLGDLFADPIQQPVNIGPPVGNPQPQPANGNVQQQPPVVNNNNNGGQPANGNGQQPQGQPLPANGNVQQPPIVNPQPVNNNNNGYNDIDDLGDLFADPVQQQPVNIVPPVGNPQPINNNNNGYNDLDDLGDLFADPVQQQPVNIVPPVGNPQPVNNNNNGYNDLDDLGDLFADPVQQQPVNIVPPVVNQQQPANGNVQQQPPVVNNNNNGGQPANGNGQQQPIVNNNVPPVVNQQQPQPNVGNGQQPPVVNNNNNGGQPANGNGQQPQGQPLPPALQNAQDINNIQQAINNGVSIPLLILINTLRSNQYSIATNTRLAIIAPQPGIGGGLTAQQIANNNANNAIINNANIEAGKICRLIALLAIVKVDDPLILTTIHNELATNNIGYTATAINTLEQLQKKAKQEKAVKDYKALTNDKNLTRFANANNLMQTGPRNAAINEAITLATNCGIDTIKAVSDAKKSYGNDNKNIVKIKAYIQAVHNAIMAQN